MVGLERGCSTHKSRFCQAHPQRCSQPSPEMYRERDFCHQEEEEED